MASYGINKQKIWSITIVSKRNLLRKDRDFVAELISEEARKTIEPYNFILHEIIESKRYSKIFIEGTKSAFANVLSVLKDNLPYEVFYTKHN